MVASFRTLVEQFRVTAALVQARAERSESCHLAEFTAIEDGVRTMVQRCEARLTTVTVSRRRTR